MVLVTDDNAMTRQALSRLLRFHGYDVRTASSGRGAMNFLRVLRPDVLVLDLRMPDVHGLDVLRAIRMAPWLHGMAVLVFTADDQNRTAALDCGAQAYIVKGQVSWGTLLAELSRLVGPDRAGDATNTSD